MHSTGTVRLGCTDCHGGNPEIRPDRRHPERFCAIRPGQARGPSSTEESRQSRSSANPTRAYTQWLNEDWNYIRFVNPGDLRVAEKTCGTSGCHTAEVRKVRTSMMTHGAMLWGAALYNNGAFPSEDAPLRRKLRPRRQTATIAHLPAAHAGRDQQKRSAAVSRSAAALGNFAARQRACASSNAAAGRKPEVGNPSLEEEPGKPEIKLSERGFGTELRTDPVFLGLQKTRLLDPLLSFPGTNDQAGDYRASGCSACHVVYANDRSPEHSGAYAAAGNLGQTATADPTIPRNQSGHPIRHQFTRSIPSSQCMVCHMHPGTNMVATYFGYTWWDNEMDGEHMWPAQQRNPSAAEQNQIQTRNPERSAVRGLWSDVGLPGENRHARVQPATATHPVRRLPQPWLDLPRRLQARSQRQPARPGRQDRSRSTIPTSSGKRCTSKTSIWKKECTASTATSSRTVTATASSTGKRATPSKSIASIATARFSSARP